MYKKILASFVIIAILGGLFYYYELHLTEPTVPPTPELTFEQQVEEAKQNNAPALSQEAAQAAQQAAAAQFANRYQSDLGFSFGYPDDLSVGSSEDSASGALTVIAQNPEAHVGFQIVITPWSEDGATITKERIEQDLPEIAAHDFAPVSLDGTPGIAFSAADAFFGNSIQIWLVRGGYLYQISTYATQGPLLSKVLGTWKWHAVQ